MSEVHFLLPHGYDAPDRPSGGNTYDRRLVRGLADRGWSVVVHEVEQAWPSPAASAAGAVAAAVAAELARIPDGGTVVVDGLLGTVAGGALIGAAGRLRVVTLVHMPGPPGGPPRAVLEAASLVVTTSRWTASILTAEHGLPAGRLVVAPPGVDPAPLAAGSPAGTALLCVAAVTRAKGHDRLFRALAGLEGRTWSCVCAGALDREPDFVQEQREVLAELGLADRVHLAGALGGADLERAYAAADLAVLPTRVESYGLVVTEALARGLPVIATDVGGVAEALGRTSDGRRPGTLVADGDDRALDQSLGQALAAWLDDDALRARLRATARRRRADLAGWPVTVETVSTALDRLAAR